MKEISQLISCAVIAGLVASCDSPQEALGGVDTVITANIADAAPMSRTAIDNTQYDGGHVGILWTPSDEIGVFSDSQANARFTNLGGTTAGRVQFGGTLSGTPRYAYYPYSADNNQAQPGAVKGSLAAVQSYDPSNGVIDGDYKYGQPRVGAEGEFDFTHIFSLLCFKVNADGTDLAGQTLKSVTMTLPEGRQLAGDFTFDITNGKYTFTGNVSNSISVQYAKAPELKAGSSHVAYLSCAPGMLADDNVTIEVLTDTHKATFNAQIAYNFKPNEVYTFDLSLNSYKDKGLTVEALPSEPEEETANCYMITEAGEHDFKATVIGNGEKGIIKGAGFHTENPYINPVSAKLLWEDVQGFITDVTLRNGRVHYTSGTNVGNAVIAVYDADGTVLWSWHIWGVGNTLPEDYEITTKVGSKFDIMDRNLGSFPATDEQRLETTRTAENEAYVLHSMLYQWGRKDPFPNSDKYYVDGAEINIANEFPVWQPATKAEATIEAGVLHPAVLINRAADSSDSHWLGTDNQFLWGDDINSENKDNGWSHKKTIYDPSPVGYRVANNQTFSDFIPVNTTSKTMKGVTSYRTGVNGEITPNLKEYISCVIDTIGTGKTANWLPKGIHKARIGFAYGSSSNSDKIFGYGVYMNRFEGDTEGNYYSMTGYRFPNSNGSRNSFAISGYWWTSRGAVSNSIGRGAMSLQHFYWLTGSGNYKEPDKGLASGRSAGVNGSVEAVYFYDPWRAQAVRCVREK